MEGGKQVFREFYLMNYGRICKSKDQGGLGVTILRDFNKALLGKWWWRLQTSQGDSWSTIIRSILDASQLYRPRADHPESSHLFGRASSMPTLLISMVCPLLETEIT